MSLVDKLKRYKYVLLGFYLASVPGITYLVLRSEPTQHKVQQQSSPTVEITETTRIYMNGLEPKIEYNINIKKPLEIKDILELMRQGYELPEKEQRL